MKRRLLDLCTSSQVRLVLWGKNACVSKAPLHRTGGDTARRDYHGSKHGRSPWLGDSWLLSRALPAVKLSLVVVPPAIVGWWCLPPSSGGHTCGASLCEAQAAHLGSAQPRAVRSLAATLSRSMRLALRTAFLVLLFTPVLLLAPLSRFHPRLRRAWKWLLLATMRNCGPAFTKWAQWAASRGDLLRKDTREVFESLQAAAPSHSFRQSRATIEKALACELCDVFTEFSEAPIASGAIAQVHRATLSARGARLTGQAEGMEVAVKVRHPRVSSLLELDFSIMVMLATIACKVPGLRDTRLDDSVRQFDIPFHQQLDLVCEAEHLDTFNHNFRLWSRVRFPQPLWPLVTEDVLVETYEAGASVSAYVKGHTPYNERIADIGLRSYLQMILKDNFVHADLHPGNIVVRVRGDVPTAHLLSTWLHPLLHGVFGIDLRERCCPVELSLLDVGMTTQLRPEHQMALVHLYQGISRMDGAAIADAMLRLRHMESTANSDLQSFRRDVEGMFAPLDLDSFRLRTQEVVSEVMDCMRKHRITMDGGPSAVLVTTLVLEGWATKLHPDIRIMESICKVLPQSWTERIPHIVDQLVSDGALVAD